MNRPCLNPPFISLILPLSSQSPPPPPPPFPNCCLGTYNTLPQQPLPLLFPCDFSSLLLHSLLPPPFSTVILAPIPQLLPLLLSLRKHSSSFHCPVSLLRPYASMAPFQTFSPLLQRADLPLIFLSFLPSLHGLSTYSATHSPPLFHLSPSSALPKPIVFTSLPVTFSLSSSLTQLRLPLRHLPY